MTQHRCASPAQPGDTDARAPAIELLGLSKSFPGGRAPALDGIDLVVPRGGIFGILGPNGAGKTTLMSILGGLILPSAGSVRIAGHDVLTESRHIRHILGLVPQEPAIYPTLTARENLDFFGRMQGLSGAYLDSRVQACLELAEMTGEADQRVEQFSGGYKRRLNMVIGLMHEPEILILDEPTVAIDPHSRALIHHRLRELNAAGITILISTHYMEEAELLCSDVAIIDHGRLIVQGSVPELLARRRDEAIELQFFSEPDGALAQALQAIPGVRQVELAGCRMRISSDRPELAIAPIMQRVQADGPTLRSLVYGRASLEQVFLSLTGDRGELR